MSSPSDTLPREVDFAADPDASPERMNVAMAYLLALVRSATAQRVEYEAALEQLRGIGLARLADALTPILTAAQAQGDAIAVVYERWVDGGAIATIKAEILASLDPRLSGIDAAISDATTLVAANTRAIAATATLQAAADADRWFNSHG
jgi:hypothetical protein